jgi:hypothetical protein
VIRILCGVSGAATWTLTAVVWSGSTLSTDQLFGQPRGFSETSASVVFPGQAHVPVLRNTRSKDGRPFVYQKS